MALLDSPRGKAWLSQFQPAELDAAIALANMLDLVATDHLEKSLFSECIAFSNRVIGSIALFVGRELKPKDLQTTPGQNYLGDILGKHHPPNPTGPGAGVGSEGRLANVIRNLARTDGRFLDHPSLDVMSRRRVRHIVILDDIVGSGRRVRGFVDHLYQHPTIKSWVSLKYIDLTVVAYAATKPSLKFLARTKPKVGVQIHRGCPTLDSVGCPAKTRALIAHISKKYAHKKNKNFALGYDDSKCLMIFGYGCPNNVPAILWQSSGWTALFPNKVVLPDMQGHFLNPSPYHAVPAALSRMRQPRLTENPKIPEFLESAQQVIVFLSAISRRIRSFLNMSIITGLSIEQCRTLRQRCLEWGLIDKKNSLTDEGRAELRRLRVMAPPSPVLDESGRFYYPKSLRAP